MSEDPRQQRSRIALTRALLNLMQRDELSSISVAALCAEAGVHRTTFYGHASSIEEFAVDVITREIDAIATIRASSGDPYLPYKKAMVGLLVHVAGEREVYRSLLKSKWGGALRVKLEAMMQNRARLALQAFAEQGDVRVPEYREEAVAFVSGGLVGTLVLWALSDDSDAEAWAVRTQQLMPEWWPVI